MKRKCDCMRSFGWGIKCDVSEFVCFWNWFIVYNTSKFDLYEQFELEKKCSVNIFQNFMGFQGFLCCWSFKFGIHTPLSNCFFLRLGARHRLAWSIYFCKTVEIYTYIKWFVINLWLNIWPHNVYFSYFNLIGMSLFVLYNQFS